MLPLSAELEQEANELRTWAHLHKADDDTDLGVWRAFVVVDKAISFIRRHEEVT